MRQIHTTRRVLIGPVPCQVCGRMVEWDGWFWLFAGTFLIHVPDTCPGKSPGL